MGDHQMTYSSGLYVIDYSPLTFIKERNLNLILIEPIKSWNYYYIYMDLI